METAVTINLLHSGEFAYMKDTINYQSNLFREVSIDIIKKFLKMHYRKQ